jgi:TrmH family RNA methyltransferase
MIRADLVELYKKGLPSDSFVVIEGLQALKHALKFKAEITAIYCPSKIELIKLAQTICPEHILALEATAIELGDDFYKLSSSTIRTKVLAIAKKPVCSLSLIKNDTDQPKSIIFLEDPRDLSNLGAAIRVAAAADCKALLTSGQANPWNFAAIRASAGLHFAIPIIKISSLQDLKTLNLNIYAMSADGQVLNQDIKKADLPKNSIFAFGTERTGISQDLKELSTATLALKMNPGVSSLNLATSVAATLYSS